MNSEQKRIGISFTVTHEEQLEIRKILFVHSSLFQGPSEMHSDGRWIFMPQLNDFGRNSI